jgi:hypothetical protein
MTLRAAWQSSPLPAVIVPAAIGPELATQLRDRSAARGYGRYGLLDRGSYEVAGAPTEPELLDALAGIATEVTGRRGVIAEARVLRLGPGDYILVRHDRVHDARPLELVLDLSPEPIAGAEVHWRHRGQVFFTMPCQPGSLAIVERGPTVMSNHTYVSKRNRNASIVRLTMLITS